MKGFGKERQKRMGLDSRRLQTLNLGVHVQVLRRLRKQNKAKKKLGVLRQIKALVVS